MKMIVKYKISRLERAFTTIQPHYRSTFTQQNVGNIKSVENLKLLASFSIYLYYSLEEVYTSRTYNTVQFIFVYYQKCMINYRHVRENMKNVFP